jgi:hypothetical protein
MVCVVVVERVFVRKLSRLCVVSVSGKIVTVGCVFVMNVCVSVARGVFMENVWFDRYAHNHSYMASLKNQPKMEVNNYE